MIRIQSTSDIARDGIKMLLYGGWGVGKTPLLATGPNPIIYSAEKGLLSLRTKRVPFIEIRNYKDLCDCYTWAAQSPEASQFYTHGLDSLSEIGEVLLAEEKRKTKDPRQAFYAVMDRIVEFSRAMRDLPGKNVVLITKEEFSKDQNGVSVFMPMLPGTKLGQQLPYFFDEVIRMIVWPGTTQRVLCTQNTYQHQARDRSGFLAEYEPPDLTVVFKKILGI